MTTLTRLRPCPSCNGAVLGCTIIAEICARLQMDTWVQGDDPSPADFAGPTRA